VSELKIAVIGAGSYVFGPSVLAGAILGRRPEGAELALVDVDRQVLDLMAGVGRRMVHEAVELDPTIVDKSAGIRSIEACLAAHADVLPVYS
jgi:alpha-galactosidase/6-phospho-beta-glucosidase family protein